MHSTCETQISLTDPDARAMVWTACLMRVSIGACVTGVIARTVVGTRASSAPSGASGGALLRPSGLYHLKYVVALRSEH